MTQKEALDILKSGHNVYLTGPAGSGKTHVLNQYIDYLKEHEVDIGVTASTGIAATHMGGMTIHAWSGLGVRDTLSEYDLEALQEKQYLWKRFEKVKVLIIDEVSMLHHFRLDLIEKIVKSFKRSEKPFGGIQIILCGDFFQLPPVSRYGEDDAHFIYHSEAWRNAGLKVCYLEEQYRQTDDAALRVLNDIRAARVDETTMEHLKRCFKEVKDGANSNQEKKKKDDGIYIEPTRLFTHNIDVDLVNDKALDRISGTVTTYQMNTRGHDTLLSILKKSCLAPEELRLKVGARVMFVKNNFELGYANGTLGVVTELVARGGDSSGGPIVKLPSGKRIEVPQESWKIEEDGKVKAEIVQYPLRLAWAITVHKSQGMSLDAVEVDLSKSFEKGMGYVALSRVRTLDGLTILGLNPSALEVDEEVLVFDGLLKEASAKAAQELHTLRARSASDAIAREKITAQHDTFIRSIAPAHVFEEKGKRALGARSRTVKKKKTHSLGHSTYDMTRNLLSKELSLKDLAKKREMTVETIINHIEKIIETDPVTLLEVEYLRETIPSRRFDQIAQALKICHAEYGDWRLSPVKNLLEKTGIRPAATYTEIQLVRVFVRGEKGV